MRDSRAFVCPIALDCPEIRKRSYGLFNGLLDMVAVDNAVGERVIGFLVDDLIDAESATTEGEYVG